MLSKKKKGGEKTIILKNESKFRFCFSERKIIQNVAPAKSTPSIGVIGMLAKPAKGELPPLPKGEMDDDGRAAALEAAAAAPAAAAAAAAAAASAAKTTPWSGDPEEVHFTGARSCCC